MASFLDEILETTKEDEEKKNKEVGDNKGKEQEDNEELKEEKESESRKKYMIHYCDEFYEAFKGRI